MTLYLPECQPAAYCGAVMSHDQSYRYSLMRQWASAETPDSVVVWIMLNPSTADATHDDPTIRRCRAFSRAWGAGAMEVVNLFAWRSATPTALYHAVDPVGPENDTYIEAAIGRAGRVIAAWGARGTLLARDAEVRRLVRLCLGPRVQCLGLTRGGHPRHPLYVPAERALEWLP